MLGVCRQVFGGLWEGVTETPSQVSKNASQVRKNISNVLGSIVIEFSDPKLI